MSRSAKKNIRAVFERELNKEAIGDLIAVDRVTRPARLDKASRQGMGDG